MAKKPQDVRTRRWKVASPITVDVWVDVGEGNMESHESIRLDPGTMLTGPVEVTDKSTCFKLDDGREISVSRSYPESVLRRMMI